jgi:competence protein ComEA
VVTVSRGQVALVGLALMLLLAVLGSRLAGIGASEGPATAAPLVAVGSTPRGGAAPAAPSVYVHVVGGVRRPGLYRLREGSRVADAVRIAGGLTGRADIALVNLAAPVADGVQIVVPVRAVEGARAAASPSGSATVSLGTATAEQLDELPGIGPVTAQKIIDWRQAHGAFRSVDELDDIPGIGPARVEQLRALVTP